MAQKFVHLHTHSEYSLLDGAARIKDLVNKAKELEMPALALTDHGVMYGIIDFYEAASQAGIKPIIGCEVYVAPGSRFDKAKRSEESNTHLVLLAENETGYRNLMKLVSWSFLEGFYYRPRVDKELLAKHAQGLIALSGCVTGEIPRLLEAKKYTKAKRVAEQFLEIFGKENFYFEVQDQGLAEQKIINEGLFKLAEELKRPVVATNDIHYIKQEDAKAHDVLLCIQTGSVLAEEDRLKFSTDQFFVKSEEEMAAIFSHRPDALNTTLEIAERCNVKIDFGRALLPQYEVPAGYTLDSYLEKLCKEGLKKRYSVVTPEVKERLEYELNIIKQMGFSGYFLIVWDFVHFAKEKGIKVGPGRGSAAGSLVSYVLGITNVDPLKHGLLFERFLNPERLTMPDIDIDFCFERRDEVIDYVTKKYGEDRVAQIITFTTMAARAATRDAGRVFDIPYGRVDKIAKLIPEGQIEGKPVTINNALKAVAELRAAYESDETTKQILDTARTLEGLARQDSIHAAGVVISDEELTEYTPIQRKSGPETVTQYHMDAIKKIGLLKMDFLGLRTLTVIDNAVKMIKQTKGIEIDIDNIPYDDDKTYEMLQQGESIGVFQLESTGMRNLLKDLQPSNFEDIVALLALYRPGPLGSGMVKDFCDRKHGRKPITYLHPSLEPILRETYGIIVYQEQVMQIASEMAGFSMAEADILRAAMSKKKADVLAEQREKFIRGAKRRGIDAKTAGKVFDLVDHFAGYGFNRSHSTAYAVISYQTAYLKANYPVEFMAALLTSVMGNKDKVAQYVNECRRLSIKVLPPDVNESYRDFTVIGGAIRFGLSAVRNVGEAAIESIIRERETGGRFKSIFDFSRRVDHTVINKRAMESLIKSGAFDSCGPSRKYMLEVFEKAIEAGVKHQKDKAIGQFTIFDLDQEETMEKMPEEAAEFEKSELLAYEKEMLGLYVTDHPLLGMESVLKNNTQFSLGELLEQRDGTVVWIGGIIVRQTRITTKKGEPMLFFTLEDLEGSIEVVAFPSIYERYKDFLSEDRVVRVKGRVDKKEDEIKFIAQEIEPLDTEESPRQLTLKIVLSTNNFNRRVIEELKTLLRNHAGPIPVCLQVMDSEKVTTLSLARSYSVTIDDGLFAELKVLLGEEAVSLQKV